MAEETPEPYQVRGNTERAEVEGPVTHMQVSRYHDQDAIQRATFMADYLNAAHIEGHARGVASANERNDAQWERVIERVEQYAEPLPGLTIVLRIIDEERKEVKE